MKNIIRLAIVVLLLAITNFMMDMPASLMGMPHNASGDAPVVYADVEDVECTESGVVCKSGALSSDESWTSDKVYVITGNLTIPHNRTLTIQAGTVVKFLYDCCSKVSLIVDGTLNVNGISGNKIYFTSSRDDAVGGDTNNDGGNTLPDAGDWIAIVLNNGSSGVMRHAEIRYGGHTTTDGVLYLDGSSPTLENVMVKHSDVAAISALPTDSPTITNFSAEQTPLVGLKIRGGGITSDVTWGLTDVVYIIPNDFTVGSGASLTIGAGVIIKFIYDCCSKQELIIEGSLNVNGTDGNPVYFTSTRDDSLGGDSNGDAGNTQPDAGDWHSIQFKSGSRATINHAEIRYSGTRTSDGAIYLEGSSPTLNNVKVKHSDVAAISALPTDSPTLSNFSAEDTALAGLKIRAGALSTDATWNLDNIVYIIENDFTIGSGATLTLEPGVVVKVAYDCCDKRDLIVEGTLNVNGSPNKKVYFTSLRDDSIPAPNGDTNGDAAESMPAPGDWKSIEFRNGSRGNINHAEIRYAGNRDEVGAIHVASSSVAIVNSVLRNNTVSLHSSGNGASPVISESDIYYNTHYAVLATNGGSVQAINNWWGDSNGPNDNGANPVGENVSGEITYASWGSEPYQFDLNGPTLFNSTLTNNTVGLYSSGGGVMPVINCSSIHDNAEYGIFSANGSLVEAINNWWGHANGPTTDGGTEFGDKIAGLVNYDPWLASTACAVADADHFLYLPIIIR